MDGAERYLCVYVENSALMALVNFFELFFLGSGQSDLYL